MISNPAEIQAGVPQKSILGPQPFLLYINDLHHVCNETKMLLYADDTAIFYSAKNVQDLQEKIANSFPK